MPWYAWLILVVAIGSIVGGLMMLRDTANKVELTEEQRKRNVRLGLILGSVAVVFFVGFIVRMALL